MKIVGLFAGVGGLEVGFHDALGDGAETVQLCEVWEPAKAVLAARFPSVPVHPDVRQFTSLPRGTDLLTAGFPCTDLSQAGRTAGIRGAQSGLVAHVFQVIEAARAQRQRVPWLMIENVSNMLSLDNGQAMGYLVSELERLGFAWAYRTVDSRFTGVPQRRRRVILLASTKHDPCSVLFADEAGVPNESRYRNEAFGFYWTEGARGLGWAKDATPTLKGGSTVGIPSPPAIWIPGGKPGRKFLTPLLEDAEAMQGLPRGWTEPGGDGKRNAARWKLVGNAVTTGVARWVAARLAEPGDIVTPTQPKGGRWPGAACGRDGTHFEVVASEYPLHLPYTHLLDLVHADALPALSHRAIRGFWYRLRQGNLGQHPGFREDVVEHVEVTMPGGEQLAIA